MILIGEAGGTKTDWRLISKKEIISITTIGFNAALSDFTSFMKVASPSFIGYETQVTKVYFYAAGIGSDELNVDLITHFSLLFPNANFEFQNDLLAAGRALYDQDEGMVGIIGTGAVLGKYQENKMIYRIPSLGYVLGDEGSGFDLGKRLVKSVLRNQLPQGLRDIFHDSFPDFNEKSIIETVYKKRSPNKEIANYTKFLFENKDHRYIYQLIFAAFKSYFDNFNYNPISANVKWRFSGSVAYYFQDILKQVGSEYDLYIDNIIKSPIELLTKYHQENG